MKKHLLFLVFAFAATLSQAQDGNMYSLMYHEMDNFSVYEHMRQRDGDFIGATHIFGDESILGRCFHKMDPSTLTITDSLFIADTAMSAFFIEQNPHGEGNIRTIFEYHEDCDSTFLRITFFPDNDLHSNPYEDHLVPLCEGYVYMNSAIIDCWGDLITTYCKDRPDVGPFSYDTYIARIGIEGTIKRQTLLHENFLSGRGLSHIRMLKESPLKYFQWNRSDTYNGPFCNLAIYEIDSLFNKNPLVISSILSSEVIHQFYTAHEYLYVDGDTQVIPIGEDEILVAAKYAYEPTQDPLDTEYGAVVAKYDIRTMQPKGYIVFNDYSGNRRAQCLGLKTMTDGTVYFLYWENGYPNESILVVKMDTDLNVEWKRMLKTDNIQLFQPLQYPILYQDEQGEEKGIAWIGNGHNTVTQKYGIVYFYLNHDGTVGVNENGMDVRPYAFYPNPAKEQLHFEFSPDVQPKQIELYDLQGRLVCTQSNTFEAIDMSQLPTGTYMLRVTLEDGKMFSDKVIKK